MQFDSDALAVIAAMTTSPPMPQRRVEINNLVTRLKSAGIWTGLDAMWMLAAQDPQAALVNWKAPGTFTGTLSGTIPFVGDRGFTGNGTTGRIGTGWTPSTSAVNFTLNDASMWVWVLTDLQSNNQDIGCRSDANANRSEISTRSASDRLNCFINSNNSTQPVVATSIGLSSSRRTSSTAVASFRNGVTQGSGTVTSTALPTVEMWLCGSGPATFSARQVAFGAVGASLSGLELSFYQILLQYMQAVGAA